VAIGPAGDRHRSALSHDLLPAATSLGHALDPNGGVVKDSVRLGHAEVPYLIVRSARRRRTIEIRVDRVEGVVVAAPERTSRAALREALARRGRWILERLAEAAATAAPRFVSGEVFPVAGTPALLDVREHRGRAPRVGLVNATLGVDLPARLAAEGREAAVRVALVRWYRGVALARVQRAVERLEPVVGARATRVLVRDQRRRWGSCAADGTLRFNWRLAMLDDELVEYVVCHELTHLLHGGHGPAFWTALEGVMPGAKRLRAQLHSAGRALPL
jgi:hypothetical protein